jgi:hypothetical protein
MYPDLLPILTTGRPLRFELRRNFPETGHPDERGASTMMAVRWHWALLAAIALASTPAIAAPLDDLHEATLDIDHDGKPDRAALVRDPESKAFDLHVYSGLGDAKLDLSRKPAVLKKALASGLVLAFESKGTGSLVVTTGCGGCSNDHSTTLTIVHRGGEFVVAGYTYDWETRNGSGKCDVNFLTGKGTLVRGVAKARPLKGKFAPIKLADWSDEKRPKGCD